MKAKLAIRSHATTLSSPSTAPASRKRTEILVAVDFSKSSRKALLNAILLAEQTEGHLTLLHVLEEPVTFRSLNVRGREQERLQSASRQLKALMEDTLPPSMSANLIVAEGTPVVEILRQAKHQHTAMIVIGNTRHPWWMRPFRGGTVAKVISQAPCPVVVVKDPSGHRGWHSRLTTPGSAEQRTACLV